MELAAPAPACTWSETRSIGASWVDPVHDLRLTALCQWLQEIAGNHAHAYGFGFHGMQALGMVWVLHLMRIEIRRLPRWRDDVQLSTWVRGFDGPFSLRDFRMTSAEGEVLAGAVSRWVALDFGSRKPVRLGSRVDAFPRDPSARGASAEPRKLPAAAFGGPARPITAQHSDIDMVGHVNNVSYLRWALDSLPEPYSGRRTPVLVEQQFIAELQAGDTGELHHHAEPDADQFSIRKSGQEMFRARIQWR
ncbi:MAG: thioesterase [Bacteroidia bacterium]|nr:thioesterase [Bacteroidia bacterium]